MFPEESAMDNITPTHHDIAATAIESTIFMVAATCEIVFWY